MDGLESKNKAESLSCAMDFYYNFREIGQIELKLLWEKTIVFFRLATRLSYSDYPFGIIKLFIKL
jgi:hypothetical protein